MSTTLSIKARASKKTLNEALLLSQDIESKLSAYRQDSDIVTINKNAGVRPTKVSETSLEAIEIALEMAKATEGLYDPSIGALSHFGYQFGWRDEKLLSLKEQKHFSNLVNYKDIILSEKTVMLKNKGMALDLGGMGKGFAVAKIVAFLQSKGVKKALVSLGGEVYAYGKVFKVAIMHPRKASIIGYVLSDKHGSCITTSGDYERYIEDYEHHHILNGSQGTSANYFASLTLISNTLDPSRMDALNTALFLLPLSEQKALIKTYNLETIALDKQLVLSLFPKSLSKFIQV